MNSHTVLKEMLLCGPQITDFRPPGRVDIPAAAFAVALDELSERIEGAARRAAKSALANLEMLRGAGIYHGLDTARCREAAALAELLRNGALIYNAGTLDVAALQQRIHHAREHDSRLVFELGWGQAKRHAGLLKTAGAGADLAEIIALGRIAILARAAAHLDGGGLLFRIICGGSRFREALFTSTKADLAYNSQREHLVRVLGFSDLISFDGIERYWAPETIRQALDQAMRQNSNPSGLRGPDIDFALFNVDWVNLLEEMSADRAFHPHGLAAPQSLLDRFTTLGNEGRTLFLRQLLTAVARRDLHLTSLPGLSAAKFVAAAEWVMNVATASARKYCLLGQLTPRGHNSTEHPIALTVLDKGPRSPIPRLMLLSKHAADCLPQHIVPVLYEDGPPRFFPYIAAVNEAAPVHIVPDAQGDASEYSWLSPSGQPLCLTTASADIATRALGRLDLLDIY